MDGRRLSLREQRILSEIEAVLRKDRRLDERLRNLRPPRAARLLALQRRARGLELSLLIPAAFLLTMAAIRTDGFGLIVACSCVGAVTLLVAADLVYTRVRRRKEAHATHNAWSLPAE
jgi:hypothetical protein